MANEIIGAKKFLTLYGETEWGTKPGSPVYVPVPVTDYGVRFRSESRQANPYNGKFQRQHSTKVKGMPSGQLACPLYGWKPSGAPSTIMQYLLDWGFGDHEERELTSKGAQWVEDGTSDKEHNGLRVNSATLEGSEDSGFVGIMLDLMGKSEAGDGTYVAQALPANRSNIVDCEFQHVTFSLGGVATLIKQFQIQVQNGLKVEYLNSFTPSLLLKSQRIVTCQVTLVKNADTIDAYRRASTATEIALQFVIKGLHKGTGTGGTNWTVATIDLGRASFIDSDDQGGKEDITKQQLQFQVLDVDNSDDNDIEIGYSEAA